MNNSFASSLVTLEWFLIYRGIVKYESCGGCRAWPAVACTVEDLVITSLQFTACLSSEHLTDVPIAALSPGFLAKPRTRLVGGMHLTPLCKNQDHQLPGSE